MSDKMELTIEALGAQGDGIAYIKGKPVFVRGALPGEVIAGKILDGRATDIELLKPSAERVAAPCTHYGVCGGCSFQHMPLVAYHAWKHALVVEALAHHKISVPVDPLVACLPRTRRRTSFTAANFGQGEVTIGYQQAASHSVVDVEDCHVITNGLNEIKPLLKTLAQTCIPPGKSGTITVLDSEQGFDVAFALDVTPNDTTRRGLVSAIANSPIGRLSVNGELLFAARPPVIQFGDIAVSPPPGGFAQAVQSAEDTMAQLVTGHLAKSKNVIDLFSGSGTFALRLAHRSAVHAVEGEQASLDALSTAWRNQSAEKKLRKVTTEKRDLMMSPLPLFDLNDFSGAVFDPPRVGAEAQVRVIAKSTIAKVAAVSCNPTTLARDLAILIDAGFKLERVVPIDQFLWSSHVEVVALLSKPPQKKRRGLA